MEGQVSHKKEQVSCKDPCKEEQVPCKDTCKDPCKEEQGPCQGPGVLTQEDMRIMKKLTYQLKKLNDSLEKFEGMAASGGLFSFLSG